MFPAFNNLLIYYPFVPEAFHLFVGTVGKEPCQNPLQFCQVLITVQSCHRAQYLYLRCIKGLSYRSFHLSLHLLHLFACKVTKKARLSQTFSGKSCFFVLLPSKCCQRKAMPLFFRLPFLVPVEEGTFGAVHVVVIIRAAT